MNSLVNVIITTEFKGLVKLECDSLLKSIGNMAIDIKSYHYRAVAKTLLDNLGVYPFAFC